MNFFNIDPRRNQVGDKSPAKKCAHAAARVHNQPRLLDHARSGPGALGIRTLDVRIEEAAEKLSKVGKRRAIPGNGEDDPRRGDIFPNNGPE